MLSVLQYPASMMSLSGSWPVFALICSTNRCAEAKGYGSRCGASLAWLLMPMATITW